MEFPSRIKRSFYGNLSYYRIFKKNFHRIFKADRKLIFPIGNLPVWIKVLQVCLSSYKTYNSIKIFIKILHFLLKTYFSNGNTVSYEIFFTRSPVRLDTLKTKVNNIFSADNGRSFGIFGFFRKCILNGFRNAISALAYLSGSVFNTNWNGLHVF